MKFHHFWRPLAKFLWLPVEKSANGPPWKKSFRCPCLREGVRASLTSRTVSKVSGTKDDDMFFNGFSSDTRALISMLRWCWNAWNYIKLHQFLDGVARNFSYTRGCTITPFYKNGVVLHNLATMFDNTNAASKPTRVTRLCTVYSAKHLQNLAKLQIIYYKSWPQPTDIFGGVKSCNLLLYLTNTYVCENFRGGNCLITPLWLRVCYK